MPAENELNKINKKPIIGEVTNFAAVSSNSNSSSAAGEQDFTQNQSKPINQETMFGEGSIGKIRFAGLAYMLQQEKIINLQDNAKDFFASEKMTDFLAKKYPEKSGELQQEIGKFFSGDSENATLADLTTHRAGTGDLTRDQGKLFEEKGIEQNYKITDLLLPIDKEKQVVKRDNNGKPSAQKGDNVEDKDLPEAKYGAHDYSNLGYMLLGLAMEQAYHQKNPESNKDYKKLLKDFMLEPVEGHAANSDLKFENTKFGEDLMPQDNLARSTWFEKGELVDATKFSGANAAGGAFTSAADSTKFFNEFFKGFPSTPEYKQENANKFFSNETIETMMAESLKFGNCGVNNSKGREGNERFQAPGFAFEIDKNSDKIISYEKGGNTFGYASFLSFNPETGAKIDMVAQENVTNAVAQQQQKTVENLMAENVGENGKFNRKKMLNENAPELLAKKEVKGVLNDLIGKISVPQNDKEDNLRPPENTKSKNPEKSSKNSAGRDL